MDTPKTPDIIISAPTFAYLQSNSPEMPLPDEFVRDDEGSARFAIYGFEHAEELQRTVDNALDLLEPTQDLELAGLEQQRLATFKMMLEGMRASIR
jgi:hypothetical protein